MLYLAQFYYVSVKKSEERAHIIEEKIENFPKLVTYYKHIFIVDGYLRIYGYYSHSPLQPQLAAWAHVSIVRKDFFIFSPSSL